MSEQPKFCGVGCAAGRKGEMLLCGFKKGHKGKHAWASLPTFVDGRSIGPDSFEAGVLATAKWLEVAPVSPPVAKGHWGNAAGAVRMLLRRGDIAPEHSQEGERHG